jgi:hypothetical protein
MRARGEAEFAGFSGAAVLRRGHWTADARHSKTVSAVACGMRIRWCNFPSETDTTSLSKLTMCDVFGLDDVMGGPPALLLVRL